MKNFRRILASLSASLVLLLTSCTAPPPPPPKQQLITDPSAIPFAINRALEFYTIVEFCSSLGESYKNTAETALKSWNTRNWVQVFAADATYTRQLKAHTIEYKGERIALQAVKLVANTKADTLKQLTRANRSTMAQQKNCEEKLASYNNGDMDISLHHVKSEYLKHLALQEERIPKMYQIPALAGSLKPLSKPGRSLYALEQEMARNNCTGGEILTLKNEWPSEAYGAFCKNNTSIFVNCEWGNCSIRK